MKKLFYLRFILSCSVALIGVKSFAQPTLNLKNFGAVGDGVTDAYPALLALADSVNHLGGANIIIPPGKYFIAAYHTKDNKVKDIVFNHCDGITIHGKQATISVNGNFKRTRDRFNGKYYYGRTNSIIPLSFNHCKNIFIEGLELNGNVNQMTRDTGLAENGTHLIQLYQCQNVSMENLFVHHAQSDGLYIKGDSSFNVKVSNATFANNARQGMSIIGLVGGVFYKCNFINTGITGGEYGRHNPSDGVDIEVGKNMHAYHILFDECSFINNQGGQIICSPFSKTRDIHLNHCRIETQTSKRPSQLIFYCDSVLIENSYIDCGAGIFYGTWGKGESKVEISHSTIVGSTTGLFGQGADSAYCELYVHDDSLICKTDTIKTYFPYIKMPFIQFTNNKVIFTAHAIQTPDGYTSIIEGKGLFENNSFISTNPAMVPNTSSKGMRTVREAKDKK